MRNATGCHYNRPVALPAIPRMAARIGSIEGQVGAFAPLVRFLERNGFPLSEYPIAGIDIDQSGRLVVDVCF